MGLEIVPYREFSSNSYYYCCCCCCLGGTVVTIRGSNLGIQSSDILSVTIGDSTCDIDTNKYEPGKV